MKRLESEHESALKQHSSSNNSMIQSVQKEMKQRLDALQTSCKQLQEQNQVQKIKI